MQVELRALAAAVAFSAAVRAHLSHIFEKTGVRMQAELVRLLMQGECELTKTDRRAKDLTGSRDNPGER
jgi:hypothetical protein